MSNLKNPPWLHLLNALHLNWRDTEVLKGNDPDPYLEQELREAGKWPPKPPPSREVETTLASE